ncbi:MAG: DUF881 domain-containing protein [Peptostreptococcaceae bacterium]|nr:DUF881 domain-containing protein [Peptostreptococcaceae bacterium]
MNKDKLIIFFMIFMVSMLIMLQDKYNYNQSIELNFLDKELLSEVQNLRKENDNLEDLIELKKAKLEKEENNTVKNRELLEELRNETNDLKTILGYIKMQGEGIILKIDSKKDENISSIMEERGVLLKIVNQAKLHGGEAVSINNLRIGPYSEIVKAGSHININSKPIEQPYEIKIIGSGKKLSKYINYNNLIIGDLKTMYDLDVNIKLSSNIIIPKLIGVKDLNYIER